MSNRIIRFNQRASLAIKCVMMTLLALTALVMTSCTGETTIPVDSVSISHNQITLTVGDDFELTALVAPTNATEPEIVFSSSDDAIATVDQNGLVTAVGAGSATITATAGEKSATCQVTVQAVVLIETINGFKAFEKGGLIGGEGGTYYPVTATAVGTDSVRYTGRGGLSWPDTANNMEPDAMGGYYDSPLQLDGLKVKFKLDDPMDFAGDHWHFISLSNQKQLFNGWNGSDPVQTFFVMIQYENGKIKLQPHYRDVIDRGEGWRYLGKSQGVDGTTDTMVTIEFNKTDAGLTVYLNGVLQYFDTINSYYLPEINSMLSNDDVYLLAGAHIGNPGGQYEGEYSFTLGIDSSASTIKDVVSIAFTTPTVTIDAGQNQQLTVNVTPTDASNQNITYQSSNVNVVTVSESGLINAIGVGTATITARLEGKSATCEVTVEAGDVDATGIELNHETLTLEQFLTGELTATVLPSYASNKNVIWTVVDGKANVALTPDAEDAQIVAVRAIYIGTVTVRASIGEFTAECNVTITKGTLNGFQQFLPGGLVNGTTYDSDILMETCTVTTACVKFTGRGGTNWGDTNNPPSTMGGIYTQAVPFENLELFYSVDGWIDGGTNHFYVIAISTEAAWFNNAAGTADTMFLMFAYNNGNVTLRAHYIGEEEGWSHIGVSQGVVAAGGQYSIKFVKVDGGYEVWMKNAGSTEYTLQNFEGTTVLAIAENYFGAVDGVYVMAGAYAQTFANPWSFTLGVVTSEPTYVAATGIQLDQETLSLEQFLTGQLTATVLPVDATNKNVSWSIVDAKTNVALTPNGLHAALTGVYIGEVTIRAQIGEFTAECDVTVTKGTLNGFQQFLPGGLVNGTTYDSNILMESCTATPYCVKFTGRGGTNWGDTNNPPSTMGGIYAQAVPFDDLEIFYSVDGWIDGGTNHFYVIAISTDDAWFNNAAGTANTLYFMFAYNNGNVTLRAHHIGLTDGWTHIGVSQGVVAAGGQYSIKFVKVVGGYEVWMKNAGATEYTLQNFEGTTVLAIAETYFGTANDVYVMAGAYAQTFANPWSFTIGVKPADPE